MSAADQILVGLVIGAGIGEAIFFGYFGWHWFKRRGG